MTSKSSNQGPQRPLILNYAPVNNHSAWSRSMGVYLKATYGSLGSYINKGFLPNFDFLLQEVEATGNFHWPSQPTDLHRTPPVPLASIQRPTSPAPSQQPPNAPGMDFAKAAKSNKKSTPPPTVSSPTAAPPPSAPASAAFAVPKVHESIIAARLQQVLKAQADFEANIPRVVGDVISLISPSALVRLRNQPAFVDAEDNNDIITLMGIIKRAALLTPSDTVRQINDLHDRRHRLYQFDTSLEEFCAAFDDIENELIELHHPTDPSQLVMLFFDRLHPSFGGYVSLLRDSGLLPVTYEDAKSKIMTYHANATAQSAQMRAAEASSRSAAPRGVQDTALVASAPPKSRFSKGPPKRFGKRFQKRDSAPSAPSFKPDSRHHSRGEKPRPSGPDTRKQCSYCRKLGSHDWQECRMRARHVRDGIPGADRPPPGGSRGLLAQLQPPPLSDDSSVEDEVIFHALGPAVAAAAQHPGSLPFDPATSLVLDTGATTHVICTRPLASNIQSIAPHVLRGIGSITATAQCDLLDLGSGLFVPEFPLNLVSFAKARSTFDVAYHDVPDHFTLSKDGQVLYVFANTGADLYVHQLPVLRQRSYASVVIGPSEPSSPLAFHVRKDVYPPAFDGRAYSPGEHARARKAREFHHLLHHPSDAVLKSAIQNGAYLECPVSAADLDLAAHILGPCVACGAGKITPQQPSGESQRAAHPTVGQLLHADVFFLQGPQNRVQPYLVTVDDATNNTLAVRLQSRNASALRDALFKLIARYNSFGLKVATVRTDRESGFLAAESYLNARGIQMQRTAAGQHASRAERMIRIIKERFRSTISSLPFRLPRMLYDSLVDAVITAINILPNRRTGTLSPREIVTGVKPDMRTFLSVRFGELVIVPSLRGPGAPSDAPRGLLSIVVGHDMQTKGVIKVFHLDSETFATRSSFQRVALSPAINTRITNLCARDPLAPDLDPADPEYFITKTFPSNVYWNPRDKRPVVATPSVPAPVILPLPSSDRISRGVDDLDMLPLQTAPAPVPASPSDSVTVPVSAPAPATAPATDSVSAPPTVPATVEPATASDSDSDTTTSSKASRPKRARRVRNYKTHFGLTILRLKQGLRQFPDSATKALTDEVGQMVSQKVLVPVHIDSVPHGTTILPCSVFFKEKTKPDGSFDKLKCRMVGGGHRQDKSLYGDISAPTTSTESVFALLAILAYHPSWHACAVDVKGAFLNAPITGRKVFMRVPQPVSQLFLDALSPSAQSTHRTMLRPDNSLIVEVQKALYGLVEAALLWYHHLTATLQSAGLQVSTYDRGVLFARHDNGSCMYVCLHVDDILIISSTSALMDSVLRHLERVYKDLNVQSGKSLFYLGLQITRNTDDKLITITQPGFIDELLKEHPPSRDVVTPATPDLFHPPHGNSAASAHTHDFASKLMKLFYLAKRSRPDLLLTTSYLATVMSNPTLHHVHLLNRAYNYLSATKDLPLILQPSSMKIHAWIDASYAVHADAKSHTGILVTIGGSYVLARATKQKLVSDSSCVAELYALHDGVKDCLWLSRLLAELGFNNTPVSVYQDNRAAVLLAERGTGILGKTKHIDVRYFSVKQHIDQGLIKLIFTYSQHMRADFFTKPLNGHLFSRLRSAILGSHPPSQSSAPQASTVATVF